MTRRQKMAAEYRNFFITLREKASYAMIQDPQLTPVAQRFRQAAADALSPHHPLEGNRK